MQADPDRTAEMRDVDPIVEEMVALLRPVDECWQPSDLLPRMGSESWRDEVEDLQAEASRLTDEMLVVLVGNVVTEEGLPSYLAALNRFRGLTDRTGADTNAWARWSRLWTAEENRHGDATRTYLYLSGRVDMGAVEATVQHFLRNGFDSRAEGDPYRGLAYASFQEHATKRSWNQVARLAGTVGAERLKRISGLVAADEARHERAYVTILQAVVRRDPLGALEALLDTLEHAVVMPGRSMTDGHDARLFAHFADVGQRLGVYTHADYAENMRQLVETLDLANLRDLPPGAAQARDAICALPARHLEFAQTSAPRPPRPVPFRWIAGRTA